MEHLDTKTPATDTYETRYKEAQAWGTKASQEAARLRAENEALKEIVPTTLSLNLSGEVQEELDTLLDTDPDAWRVRLNELEGEARTALNSRLEKAQADATIKTELNYREKALDAFINNPDTVLTTDSLDEIPVRLQKKLEAQEITFDEFLVEADKYLKAGKTVANPSTLNETGFNTAGVGTPTATSKDVTASYGKAIF